jgi:hypothetical protein
MKATLQTPVNMMGENLRGCLVTITGNFRRNGQRWLTAVTKTGWKIMGPETAFKLLEDAKATCQPLELTPQFLEGIKKLKAKFAKR